VKNAGAETVTLQAAGYRALPTGEEAMRGLVFVGIGYMVISAADAAVKSAPPRRWSGAGRSGRCWSSASPAAAG
jgi:hypothetical protein